MFTFYYVVAAMLPLHGLKHGWPGMLLGIPAGLSFFTSLHLCNRFARFHLRRLPMANTDANFLSHFAHFLSHLALFQSRLALFLS